MSVKAGNYLISCATAKTVLVINRNTSSKGTVTLPEHPSRTIKLRPASFHCSKAQCYSVNEKCEISSPPVLGGNTESEPTGSRVIAARIQMGLTESNSLSSLSASPFLKFLKDKQVESVECKVTGPWANFHDKTAFNQHSLHCPLTVSTLQGADMGVQPCQ